METGTNDTELETTFERDALGRLLVKTLPDGSKIEYQYDQNGNLTSVDDGETPLAWRYDIMDRVIESHAGWSSQFYEYDELGLLSQWQLPDANVLSYQRAKGGVLRAIHLNDAVLTQHIYQNGLEVMRNQGELKSHFNYDDQGHLVNQSHMVQGREKQRRQYAYDGAGNLTHITDKQRGETFYDYDPLSRLTAVRGNLDEQFTHDATSNLISNHLNRQNSELFEHAPGNQLKIHGDSHYEYDEFGRLIKESRGKQQRLVTHYEHDCQHRLIHAAMPDGSEAHYRYDAFGRRIEKRVIDKTGVETTTEFLWQGDNLIAEMTNSEQYQSYVYEPGTFRPLALLKGEGKDVEVYHYHLDQIGTPLDITTPQGDTVWSVQYRAYGNVFKKTVAQIDSPLRFQGQYFDTETGLHYNRHRYYNPSAGRFITIDPIGLAGGLNNYQYVPNPTGWVDPLGLHNVPGNGCPDANKRLSSEAFDELTNNFASEVNSSNFSVWKKSMRQNGISDSNIQDLVHHGSLKKGYNIFGDDWAKYYSEISGTELPRDIMSRPHAHHMVEKKGGKAAGDLNRQILGEANINPLLSKHNLTWAPNVKGQHGSTPQMELLKKLLPVRGNRSKIIAVLKEWDKVAKLK